MAAMTATSPNEALGLKIAVSRVFDAPRELVFKMWTDARHMAEWWGPKGFTNPVCELDVWPGGDIRIVMRGPDGVDYPLGGFYRNIVEPEGLVLVTVAEDDAGHPLLETLTIVAFIEQGGKTKVAVRASAFALDPEAAPLLEGMQEGWAQSLERLREQLNSLASKGDDCAWVSPLPPAFGGRGQGEGGQDQLRARARNRARNRNRRESVTNDE